jgi:hypothetical protein
MRREGAISRSSSSSSSGGNKKYNASAKASACAVQGNLGAAVSDSQPRLPVGQKCVDAQARRSAQMSEVVTPPPLVTRSVCEPALPVGCVDSSNVTAAINHQDERGMCGNADCSESFLDASETEFYQCQYAMVEIKNLSRHRALIDSGSNVSCINADLIKDKPPPVVKQLYLLGLSGQPTLVDVVKLHLKPVVE